MRAINLTLHLSDELGIKSIDINYNDTNLPSNSELLFNIAMTLLKSLHLNEDSVKVQDLLQELNIKVADK